MFDSLDYKTNVNEKTYIYQLNLDKGKYYVGKTINIDRRMEQHFSGHGSKVTKKFKPITGQTVDSCYGFFGSKLEQYHTNELIKEYGYENVRGGKYTNSNTLKDTSQLLESDDNLEDTYDIISDFYDLNYQEKSKLIPNNEIINNTNNNTNSDNLCSKLCKLISIIFT